MRPASSNPTSMRTRRRPARVPVQRATGPLASTQVGAWQWANSGIVREPFLQAWQKNKEELDTRNPFFMAVGAVYSCVTIIANDIAKLRLMVERVRKMKPDTREYDVFLEDRAHPVAARLRAPNYYETRMRFMERLIISRLMRGNYYVFQEFTGPNETVPRSMHVLNPDGCKPLIAPDGSVFYSIAPTPFTSMLFGDMTKVDNNYVVPARFIIHGRMNCLYHPLLGVSPLFAAASAASIAGRIGLNSDTFFANMSRPGGILVAPGEVKEDTAARLQREWDNNYHGAGSGKTAVLTEGLDYKPLAMAATDAQLIEQLRWSVEDIARVFRVPGFLLGNAAQMTFRNSEASMRAYYSGCLGYHLEDIEADFDRAMGFSDAKVVTEQVVFDLSSMLRSESDIRFATYKIGTDSGVLAINDVRVREGEVPVIGGDEPRLQMQYVPISKITGETVAPTPNPAPVDPNASVPDPAATPPDPAAAGKDFKIMDMLLNDAATSVRALVDELQGFEA